MTDNERKLRDMIDRFLNEGDYNDEGDYVFVSDTQETGPLAEPDTMVPKIVLDASALLRELQDTGKPVIPDVVIQDNRIGTQNRTSPHGDAIAKLEREAGITPTEPANDANFAIYKEVCAAGNITMPFWDWLDAGKPTSMPIAAPVGIAAPLQSYSVTWRRPTAAYAHDEIEATSAEDALMQAKTRVTSRNKFDGSFPYFETDGDSMDACDWISVEGGERGKVEHVEWELPHPSAGVLMKALLAIVAEHDVFTKNGLKNSGDVSPIKLANLANAMRRIAENALANAIPGGG